MEQASAALLAMDYLACESLCVQALRETRQAKDWPSYQRILLPLQESRRQRRMIAGDAAVRLGSTGVTLEQLAQQVRVGCVVLTHPHSADDALALKDRAARERRCVEVLFADNVSSAVHWTLRSFEGPRALCTVDAPPTAWIDRPLQRSVYAHVRAAERAPRFPSPPHWFIHATEALGDELLRGAEGSTPRHSEARLEALEAALAAMTDHEILHQRLFHTARALAQA